MTRSGNSSTASARNLRPCYRSFDVRLRRRVVCNPQISDWNRRSEPDTILRYVELQSRGCHVLSQDTEDDWPAMTFADGARRSWILRQVDVMPPHAPEALAEDGV